MKLGDVCDLVNGYAFKSNDYVEQSNTLNCRMSNIRPDGRCDMMYSPKYLPDDFAKKYSDFLLKDGDLIIAMTDMADEPKILGVPTVVETLGFNVLLNQRVGKLILLDDGINPSYLKLLLLSKKSRDFLKKFAGGGLQINIGKKDILGMPIVLPNIEEQNIVVSNIEKIEGLVVKRKQQLRKLDELVKARFVEMFGTINDNKFNFDIVCLQEVSAPIKDGTHQTPTYTIDEINGYKFLSSKDVTKGKIDWSNVKYIPRELHEELYSKIKPEKGDILLAKNGTTGIAAIVDKDIVFDIYVSLALIKPININSIYLWAAINSFETKKQFDSSLKGIGVPNLHLGEIKKAKILYPPLGLQKQFADFVEQIDKSKLRVQKSLDKLETLKKALMQKYFG